MLLTTLRALLAPHGLAFISYRKRRQAEEGFCAAAEVRVQAWALAVHKCGLCAMCTCPAMPARAGAAAHSHVPPASRALQAAGFAVEQVPPQLLADEYSEGDHVVLRMARLDGAPPS